MHDLKTTVASRTLMRNYIAEMVEADSGWSDQNRDQGWLLDDVDELERQLAAAYSALGPGASRSIELHDHRACIGREWKHQAGSDRRARPAILRGKIRRHTLLREQRSRKQKQQTH